MDSLTDEQRGILNEFVAITNVSLEDEEKINKSVILLQNHSFNLNNAVLSFFESGLDNVVRNPTPIEEVGSVGSSVSGFERFESAAIHRNLHDEFVLDNLLPKLPKAPRIGNQWQFDLGIHMSRRAFIDKENEKSTIAQPAPEKKLSILWIILLIIPKALSMLYSFMKFMLGLNTSPLYKAIPRQFCWDNYDESYNLVKQLEDIDTTNIPIRTEDFNKYHEESQKNFRFLTTILVDDSTIDFARKLIGSPSMKSLLDECPDHDIFLANVDRSPEAFELSQTYKVRRLPFVMLVGNVSRNPQVMSSMSIIYKTNVIYGEANEDPQIISRVLRNLKKNVQHYNPQLVTKRYDKQEMELSRLLKEKQDEAYLESLAQDREKKKEIQRKEEEERSKKELEAIRRNFINSIIERSWFEEQAKEFAPKDCVRVSIKIPDGRRVIQKFPKTLPVVAVYLFVETQLFEKKEEEQFEESDLTLEEFYEKFAFNFEIFKPFPRSVLPCATDSIEDFGELKSGDNILVEYLEEGGSGSEEEEEEEA